MPVIPIFFLIDYDPISNNKNQPVDENVTFHTEKGIALMVFQCYTSELVRIVCH